MNKIVSFGEIIIDKVVIDNNIKDEKIGGAPLNFISMVSKFRNNISYISSFLPILNINNEVYLNKINDILAIENVNKDYLTYIDNTNIGFSLAKIDSRTKDREFSFNLDKASFLNASNMDFDKLKKDLPSIFYLGTIPFLSKTNKEEILKILDIYSKNNVTIVFDPNYRKDLFTKDSWKEIVSNTLRFTHILKIGKDELSVLTNNENYIESLKELISKYQNLAYIFLTDSDKDMVIVDSKNKEGYIVSPLKFSKHKIKDAIGCGDASFGGFIGYLSSLKDFDSSNLDFTILELINATKVGSICGGLTLLKEGALPMPSEEEIKNLVNERNIKFDEITNKIIL